ncbi:DUF4235 domain-containing protein [Rhodococcus rhodnii]|uniref:Integral membrane protein n=2 Tax=Rhodococcus rhodnii TaxID=38312 RepID=R7WJZ9_9NOCA|nr:DUF4235 domain-containing protein [Rhodococcus rhodnii]EOM75632.1 hypothetical protein Rrhod_3092 [Rhodococcus rhodnii LMG 5362]TXG91852.1 DUF4235 domain-containing protein [Rhodococcus rhodnii]
MSAVSKALYKPLSLGTSVVGGIVAGAVFNQVWKRVSTNSDTPDPKDLQRSIGEVLLAAALQGVVFAVVRAAVDRAGARGYKAVTHTEPT